MPKFISKYLSILFYMILYHGFQQLLTSQLFDNQLYFYFINILTAK